MLGETDAAKFQTAGRAFVAFAIEQTDDVQVPAFSHLMGSAGGSRHLNGIAVTAFHENTQQTPLRCYGLGVEHGFAARE